MCASDESLEQEFKCTPLCMANRLLQSYYQGNICLNLHYIYSFILYLLKLWAQRTRSHRNKIQSYKMPKGSV